MLGVLLLSSCLEDENEQAFQKINPEIEAAKSWYESFDKEYQPAENARQSSKAKGKPDWSQSKIYRQADGKKVIEVRFNFEQIDIPSHLKTEELSKNSVLQTLLLYPKENGTYIPYFLVIYPDDPNFQFEQEDFHRGAYQSIPEEFSGVYRFYRWNGNFIGGWRIKNGVKTHRLKEFKSKTKSESSRISSGTLYCYVIETTWYTYTCFEGIGCTTPQEDGRDINGVECEYVLAPPSPMDPDTGGGGGGTPPSGNECEQPEGNILDVPVECEEEEIDLTKLSNCHQFLINELIGSSQAEFRVIFEKFSGSLPPPYNFNVKFQYGNCPNSSAGCTSPLLINNEAVINLNKSIISNSTDLSIARTVLHEMLHAYFLFLEDFPTENQDLNTLLNYYIAKYNIPSNINYNPIHHNLFVENMFLNDIALELRNFAEGLGYPTSVLSNNEFFIDMAWAGLTDTDVFNKLSISQKNRISNIYYSELNGTSSIGTIACN
ncbi:SprT family zinc-dependent metalloprotease [Algoriphagus algorifonticola]|uniref:SprT family zinc-dependent metalloprotease n=1 Tax=Algoriphagus algorifonticola TaxID=2593007 RepID=UPI00119D97DC|nr:SprT family zinc-dependent metalloprotease [Algoriphagus algorifonticola]